ncbi:dynein axonemal intermediate chain 4 [Anarrhichthys ocellatus]|uniref:dynein axonemal intermediate chain 4 n=1 Tax=Anarrhichthys ocellatus TaxID=433405 RepID=UPI0012ED819F|nr:WD repeat-containing protein 78-like [Anarrhichthys ocellatus]
MRKSSLARSSSSFRSSRSSISVGGRKRNKPERSTDQAPRRAVRVLDVNGNDVTPLPLHRAEPGDVTSQPDRRLLDELFTDSGSDHVKSCSSFCGTSCSSFLGSSGLFDVASLTKDSEHSVPKLDTSINPPITSEVPRKRDNVKQHVTEEMLAEGVDICLSETDTISPLDIPSIFMSEDADDAEAFNERNVKYAELCKNRLDNDKYVERPMQTFNGALKDKQIQTDKMAAVDEGAIASVWDIYDSFCNQNKTPSGEEAVYPETAMNTSKGQEKRGQQSSNCSSFSTASTICSKLEMEMCEDSFNADYVLQLIMSSESFQYSLLVMERSIVANIFQTMLAAYRQLPTLEDPDSTVKPGAEERNEDGEESSSSPTVEHVLTLSCKLTRGCNITSMAWNKKNLDILAVGYGDFESRNQKPSLICCWCLNNPTWPERVFHCHSCVISLDFSADHPSQLAVGMHDGTVAIYDVSQYNVTCIADSSDCFKKHLKPVWQVNWIKPAMTLSGEDRDAVVSVSEDGRMSKWFHCSNRFDCSDLMKLGKKYAKIKKTKQVLPLAVTSVFCVDFHPTDSNIYVVGTSEGPIHKGCVSNNLNFLDTYQHFRPVNHIEWSPFSSDVFLSCSSGRIIHLWRKDLFTPLMSLTSTQMAVDAVKWSPNWSTIFAARNEKQVEIWDLNSSIIHPTIVHHAAAGVKVKSLLFTRGTDCVLVGDTDGQVTVYRIKNLRVGEDKQVDSLDDIINSAASS